jgi:spoIIIJ-associated protein
VEAPKVSEPRRVVSEEYEAALPSREQGEKAAEILKEILRLMDMAASVVLEQRPNEFVLMLTGKDGGALIGRNGQTLDALEYVLNRIVTRSEEAEAHIALDAEGYRERRRKNLENLALRLGERAKRRKKPVALSPLSPRDRRVIHLTLEGDPLVTTKSMGRGYFRRLYIVPEEGLRRERGRGGPRMPAGDS